MINLDWIRQRSALSSLMKNVLFSYRCHLWHDKGIVIPSRERGEVFNVKLSFCHQTTPSQAGRRTPLATWSAPSTTQSPSTTLWSASSPPLRSTRCGWSQWKWLKDAQNVWLWPWIIFFFFHWPLRHCTESPGTVTTTSWTVRCTLTTCLITTTSTRRIATTLSATPRGNVGWGKVQGMVMSVWTFGSGGRRLNAPLSPPTGFTTTWNTRSSRGAWSSPSSPRTPGARSKTTTDSWVGAWEPCAHTRDLYRCVCSCPTLFFFYLGSDTNAFLQRTSDLVAVNHNAAASLKWTLWSSGRGMQMVD